MSETGWLLEWPTSREVGAEKGTCGPEYVQLLSGDPMGGAVSRTTDHLKAFRCAREEDAVALKRYILSHYGHNNTFYPKAGAAIMDFEIVEHMWETQR